MELGLAGRRVLVTGSHRGTGEATARVLAGEGAHVLVGGVAAAAAEAVAARRRRSGATFATTLALPGSRRRPAT